MFLKCFIENILEQHSINISLLLQYMTFLDHNKTSETNVYTMSYMMF